MRPLNTLIIFGTRPEAIKLAPLIKQLAQDRAFELTLCVTGQHREMLDQVLTLFDIVPDIDLNLMQQGQSLTHLTAHILLALEPVFTQVQPDLVVVHGDTTTAFSATLGAFYQHIPVVHIEAGLRSHNFLSPFPEEANRCLTAPLATWHFAPTERAKQDLITEGICPHHIWVTGNTVIDALYQMLQKIQQNPSLAGTLAKQYSFLDKTKKRILVTAHRRENLNENIMQLCKALTQLTKRTDVQIIFAVHPNPKIQQIVFQQLADCPNLILLPPQEYLAFIYLMSNVDLILTDSGGIQEEAPALNKPVLLMRDVSERVEALQAGTVKLVGTDSTQIVAEVETLLTDQHAYHQMAQAPNPYGDGRAVTRIIAGIKQVFFRED